jgi:KDO2-lipid IV(A) lauroyltransferase
MISTTLSTLKNLVIWLIYAIFRPLMQFVPLSWVYSLATGMGIVASRIASRKRKVLEGELHKIFIDRSPEEFDGMVRRSFIFYYKRQMENLLFGYLTKARMGQMVSIQGLENLEATLGRGKGAIICLSHFGSFLLIPPALGFLGYRVNQVFGGLKTKPHLTPFFERILAIRRDSVSELPISFISADSHPRAIFSALKRNELVAIALDGRVSSKWVPVRMFNGEVMMSPGPVRIAMTSGTPVIPTFIVRNNDDTHTIILEPPLVMEPSKNYKDIAEDLQKLASRFEHYIKLYPCHIGMILQIMHDREKKGIIDHSILP